MAVPTLGRGRQPHDELRADSREHSFERDGRDVVTLVHDDVAVVADDLVDLVAPDEALDHRDVQAPVRLSDAASDSTDLSRIDAEMQRQLLHPLVQERLAVDEYDRRAGPGGDQVRADDRLPRSRRGDEDAGVVGQQHLGRLLLPGSEPADERHA